MRKNILAVAALCYMTMLVLTACTDKDDNPVIVPSAVDNGTWQLSDETMDTSVRPGDDFFMYCNGGFWKTATVDESKLDHNCWFKVEVPQMIKQRLSSVNIPSLAKMKADAANMDEAAIAQQEARIQSALDRIEAITTREEAWTLLGELMKEGYKVAFRLMAFSKNGKVGVLIVSGSTNDFSSVLKPDDPNDLAWRLANDPKMLSCVRPLLGSSTRGFDQTKWPMYKTIFETLGIPLEDAYVFEAYPEPDEEMVADLVANAEMLQELEPDDWKEFLTETVTSDTMLFDDDSLDEWNEVEESSLTREDLINNFASNYLKYEKSKVYSDAYVTTEMKQRTMAYCEQLRQTFRNRIEQSEWMSDATKQCVTEKLNAMTFNVGCPDEWFTEGLPDISQEQTLLDDVMGVRRSNLALVRRFVGMDTQQAGFHIICGTEFDLTVVNAFYVPNHNSMYIFPTWMMDPFYNPNDNDAHNYAVLSVFGHEITHGFDTNGSCYNKIGDLEDIWASEADRQEYLRRTQMLIDCYNGLEVMPWALPGIYNDGEYTITENLADLGGFLLAYDTYIRHLRESGFTGEQLDLQRQRYYLAIGWLWHGKYSVMYALNRTLGDEETQAGKDVHSLFRERVNGMVMNTDDWYSLFPIATTDLLYRAPEDRARIW